MGVIAVSTGEKTGYAIVFTCVIMLVLLTTGEVCPILAK